MKQRICNHIASIQTIKTAAEPVCEECIKAGGTWVHLRTCQTCGVTLCCDSSPAQHMTAHYNQTGHPVISSAEEGENWLWCYEDNLLVEYSEDSDNATV